VNFSNHFWPSLIAGVNGINKRVGSYEIRTKGDGENESMVLE